MFPIGESEKCNADILFSLQLTGSIAVAQCNLRASGPPSQADRAPSWTASTAQPLEALGWCSACPTASCPSTLLPLPPSFPRCLVCPQQGLWFLPEVTIAPARCLPPAPRWVCSLANAASPAVWSSRASLQLRGETPAIRSPQALSTSPWAHPVAPVAQHRSDDVFTMIYETFCFWSIFKKQKLARIDHYWPSDDIKQILSISTTCLFPIFIINLHWQSRGS